MLSDDLLVVGSVTNNTDTNGENIKYHSGAAYVFKKNKNGHWEEAQKLVASDRKDGDFFGWSVKANKDFILVSAAEKDCIDQDNINNDKTGSCYLFKKQANGQWKEIQKFSPTICKRNAQFGSKVDMNDQYIFIGSYWEADETNTGNAGAVYVYKKSDTDLWKLQDKLVSDSKEKNGMMGSDLDINQHFAFINSSESIINNDTIQIGQRYIYQLVK